MELHQLRYFVAAAESGGMREAARASNVSQPSLSKQIRKLEEEIGQPLLERSSRGVALTAAGRLLLPRARAVLSSVDGASELVRQDLELQPAELRIGAIPTMAPFILPSIVRHLRQKAAGVRVVLIEDLTERLVAGAVTGLLDLAIVSTPVSHARLSVEVLTGEPLLVALPRAHAMAKRRTISTDDLRDEPQVVLSEMHCLGQQVADYCAAQRLGRNIVCQTTQLATVLEMVRLGVGVALIPQMSASKTGVVFTKLKGKAGETPTRDIAVAWPIDRPRHPSAVDAIEHLKPRLDTAR